jgi:hypothetical protein
MRSRLESTAWLRLVGEDLWAVFDHGEGGQVNLQGFSHQRVVDQERFPREKIKGAAFDGLPLSFQLLHLSVLPPGFQPLLQKRASTNAHSRHQASKANQSVEMGQIGIHSGSFNTMPGCMSSGEES